MNDAIYIVYTFHPDGTRYALTAHRTYGDALDHVKLITSEDGPCRTLGITGTRISTLPVRD